MNKQITRTEYLEIAGLLALGRRSMRQLNDLVLALGEVTGEGECWGHCADAIYEDYTPEWLMENLGLEVTDDRAVDQAAN